MIHTQGEKIRGILPDELKWLESNGIDLVEALSSMPCKNTGIEWDGDMKAITIACLHNPARILWWYKGTKCVPKYDYQ